MYFADWTCNITRTSFMAEFPQPTFENHLINNQHHFITRKLFIRLFLAVIATNKMEKHYLQGDIQATFNCHYMVKRSK